MSKDSGSGSCPMPKNISNSSRVEYGLINKIFDEPASLPVPGERKLPQRRCMGTPLLETQINEANCKEAHGKGN